MIAFIFLSLVSSAIHAQAECRYSLPSDRESIRLRFGKSERLSAVPLPDVEPNIKERAAALLAEGSSPSPNLILKIKFFVTHHNEVLKTIGAAGAALEKKLSEADIDYVGVDMTDKRINELVEWATRFNPKQPARSEEAVLIAEDIEHLVLLTVGPVIYLRARNPELFADTPLVGARGWPASGERRVRVASNRTSLSEAMDRFKRNKGSRRTLQRVSRELNYKYANLSDDEIRKRVLSRFWRPAKGTVREWLEGELRQRRRGGPQIRQVTRGKSDLVAPHSGTGMIFLGGEGYLKLEEAAVSYCREAKTKS